MRLQLSQLDSYDKAMYDKRFAEWSQVPGPRVGDWVRMPDGGMLRFTHDWGDSIQTTSRKMQGDASFHFFGSCMSYSGTLDPPIEKANLVQSDEDLDGSAWFFHHNEVKAHNGVYFMMPCRVFLYKPG